MWVKLVNHLITRENWFKQEFGFVESNYTYEQVRNLFEWDSSNFILKSNCNQKEFYVGPFTTPTIKDLTITYQELSNNSKPKSGLKFQTITNSVQSLINNKLNEGSIFQVASQFNCLEMINPLKKPEDGISDYEHDKTQGPACALSCPAATVYRNYFLNYDEKTKVCRQINLLENIEKYVNNEENQYWVMKNGYSMAGANFSRLKSDIENKIISSETLMENLKIGIHWQTDVCQNSHRICQVFCSALPVAYNSQNIEEWECFARLILEGFYKGLLLVGGISALQKKKKVKVFLTLLGELHLEIQKSGYWRLLKKVFKS